MMLMNTLVRICFSTSLANASLHAILKRQHLELRDNYDFVIAGGGTSGLTVADRLSEAFPNKTVLVVEYGEVEYARGVFDPPDTVFGGASTAPRPGLFNFQSLPNAEVKNKLASVWTGKTVGGSSAVNGMVFDRPSRFDFAAWAQAGSPEFDASEHKWDWEGVFPYYQKSVTFTEPRPDIVGRYGYTWDTSAYGGSTPIYSSFPPFQWADHLVTRDAWKEAGVQVAIECAGGDKEGLCWMPISEHPVTYRRSHAGLGHYAALPPRANYHLLVKHQVVRVVYPTGITSGPPLVEIRALEDGRLFNINVNAEVVISAGALHTPTILLRSGIGSKEVLDGTNITVVHELPGVGANLQDHSGPTFAGTYTKPGNFSPMPPDMLKPAFAADAAAGFNETSARGPYTLAMSNSGIYLSLPHMTTDYMAVVNNMRGIVANDSASAYLPSDYYSDPSLLAGYKRQLIVLADFYANPQAPTIEAPWATGFGTKAILLHPLSRGTVRLNLTDHLAQPILDYRTGSNPIDFDTHLAHLKYLRRIFDTPTMRRYGAIETGPGPDIQSDDALREYIKDSMTFSFLHPCCTAAMLPKSLGGVVGPDLKVHGLQGLRVVDISIMPFLVSSHTSSTAYALGEKAADMVIRSWKL